MRDVDFNDTSTSFVNTHVIQNVPGEKRLAAPIHISVSPIAFLIGPGSAYIGEPSILLQRYPDDVAPSFGDAWKIGQSIRPFASSPSYYDSAFSIVAQGVSGGFATEINYLAITADGNVIIHPIGSFSSPSITIGQRYYY